jgi:hypothetical protein
MEYINNMVQLHLNYISVFANGQLYSTGAECIKHPNAEFGLWSLAHLFKSPYNYITNEIIVKVFSASIGNNIYISYNFDRLCSLVVRVPGYT